MKIFKLRGVLRKWDFRCPKYTLRGGGVVASVLNTSHPTYFLKSNKMTMLHSKEKCNTHQHLEMTHDE